MVERCFPNGKPHKQASLDIQLNMVSELIDIATRCWNIELVKESFCLVDADAILDIPLSRRNMEDKLMWLPDPLGQFTIKSAYNVAREEIGREKL